MHPKDPDLDARDPQKKDTTSDQIAEMESEGQASKPGTSAPTSPPTRTESPRAGSMEGAPGRPIDPEPDRSESDQDIDTAGTEADAGSANARKVRKTSKAAPRQSSRSKTDRRTGE